jgi:hypothetical protein
LEVVTNKLKALTNDLEAVADKLKVITNGLFWLESEEL